MTPSHFKQEMDRLMEMFGPEQYPKPRLQAIWKYIENLPDYFLTESVDYFIGACNIRYPPLLKEFQERIALFQESTWTQQKESENKFYNRMYEEPLGNTDEARKETMAKVIQILEKGFRKMPKDPA